MVSMLPISTNLDEIKPTEQIRLYPNPFQNQLVVETKKWMDSKKYQLHFFDITGKLFKIHPIENTTIPTSNWQKGLYIYKLIDSNGSVIGKGKVVK